MSSELHRILDRSGFAPTTRESYANVIDRWIAFAGEDPSQWTRPRAQDFYDWLLESGVKVKTANHYLASLRYVSKWYSVRVGRPEADFAIVQTRADEESDSGRHALTQDEITRLLSQCASGTITPVDHRDFTLLVVGFETGMRRKSLAGMQLERIGVHDRYGHPSARVPIKGAGGIAEFDVPLSDLSVEVLDSWRSWLKKHKYTKGPVFVQLPRSVDGRGRTLHTPTGVGISKHMINKIVLQRSQAAGIGHAHAHLLRHTFISLREAAEVSQVQIASITGHNLAGKSDGEHKWGVMAGYIDLGAVGTEARNTTPDWLARHVRRLLPTFT